MADLMREVFARLEELERRMSQMVVRGKIAEVNPAKALAKVEYGEGLTTGWLTWKPIRSGKAVVWWVPEVGEGVTVISEGDLRLGEIFLGSYHEQFSAPSQDPDVFLVEFGDGSKVSHNRKTGVLDVINVGDVNLTTQANLAIKCDGNVTIDAQNIAQNGGTGVVTTSHICHFTGCPHGDGSLTVKAGK